jgi:predicted DNA-binding transcriptional regulator YafY
MARAERLLELAELLRRHDSVTIATLAERLGVSGRTVFRDLASLRARGLPISGDSGPGGGIRLDPAHRSAVQLSVTEIAGLWLAARLAREASALPWSDAATTSLSKLLASLPIGKADDLRRLCRRVIVGPPASVAIRAGAGAAPPELLRMFEDAFSSGQTLRFSYINKSGEESRRTVEPHGLLVQPPIWYILAWDVGKKQPRTFRMDRILRPRIWQTTKFRPDINIVRVQVPHTGEWKPLLGSL